MFGMSEQHLFQLDFQPSSIVLNRMLVEQRGCVIEVCASSSSSSLSFVHLSATKKSDQGQPLVHRIDHRTDDDESHEFIINYYNELSSGDRRCRCSQCNSGRLEVGCKWWLFATLPEASETFERTPLAWHPIRCGDWSLGNSDTRPREILVDLRNYRLSESVGSPLMEVDTTFKLKIVIERTSKKQAY